jgi:hypothetical protein
VPKKSNGSRYEGNVNKVGNRKRLREVKMKNLMEENIK